MGSIDGFVYRHVTNQIHEKCRAQNEQLGRLQTYNVTAPLFLLRVLKSCQVTHIV